MRSRLPFRISSTGTLLRVRRRAYHRCLVYGGESVRVRSGGVPARRREKGNEADNLGDKRQRKGDLRATTTILRLGGTRPEVSGSGGRMAMVVAGNEHGESRF